MADKDVVYADAPADGVQVIYLNQPAKKNAISAEMMIKLDGLLAAADADADVRAVVLRGEGDVFSSGGDLSQSDHKPTPEEARATFLNYVHLIQRMRTIAKPIVAMVDRYAVGGAFAMTLASDLVVATDRAAFVPAFCQIGIIPEMGMMDMLPKLVGMQRAKEILYIGGKIPAAKMHEWGLVNRLTTPEELESTAMDLARTVASMPAPSIQITKGILNSLVDGNLNACMQAESTASPFCTTTAAYAKTMERFNK